MNETNGTMKRRTEGHGGIKGRLAKLGAADLFLGRSDREDSFGQR